VKKQKKGSKDKTQEHTQNAAEVEKHVKSPQHSVYSRTISYVDVESKKTQDIEDIPQDSQDKE